MLTTDDVQRRLAGAKAVHRRLVVVFHDLGNLFVDARVDVGLERVDGVRRIRFTSPYPNDFTDPNRAKLIPPLQAEVKKALADPKLQERLNAMGAGPGGIPSADFSSLIQRETKLWSDVSKTAGVRAE